MLENLTLLGMSGVGKTHLSSLLAKEYPYYHYSADYYIGHTYLSNEILNTIIAYASQDPYLKELIDTQSINISHTITPDNLSAVSHFLGKVGNPLLGGLELAEFKRRQTLHLEAEKKALLDIGTYMNIAKQEGYNYFINDVGGSVCEIEDEHIYQTIADNTTIVYIKADDEVLQTLIDRAIASPKPMYYNPCFFTTQLNTYLAEHHLEYVAQINPDDFVRWVFPKLVAYRQPKYEHIANNYGITISAKDLYACQNAAEFFDLCNQ